MIVNIFLLLGGMTTFVSVVLYSVIKRVFRIPDDSPRSRRSSRRRAQKSWFELAVSMVVKFFLYLGQITGAALEPLYPIIKWSFYALKDLWRSVRAPPQPKSKKRETQPARTHTRSSRSTRVFSCEEHPREAQPSPASSSESSTRTPPRSLGSTRVSPRARRSQYPLPAPASSSGSTTSNSSPSRASSIAAEINTTQVRGRSQAPPLSRVSSSGGSTLIGTPSKAPSIAAQNNTTQATQRRGRPTRRCEIKAFIASVLDPSFEGDPAAADAFNRIRSYMETNLNINPGTCRLAALLSLIYELHFAIAPDRSLPVPNPEQSRYISARELACVFLNRYGPIIWPTEPEPALHLTNRDLQFPRDATIQEEQHEKWRALLVKPPARGSAGDLAMSVLGERMTAFVRLVYPLPVTMQAEPDWDAVAFVLDDTRVGQVEGLVNTSEWSEALLRSVPVDLTS